ncbi:MAG TPA: biosynthetic-type acetolactate synthase large subunit [Firmicutes bacterium]|nr:biosynthetic-type acetolactate synthase large subunit [Bacillota bacterium]
MKLTGAQILVECLKEEGVEVLFGYPGGKVLSIYDALYQDDFSHIINRHEQGAVHAADGYARATGRPGVCLATSGPGATNLVTGLATAYMDSVPVIAFTGQVPTTLLGRDTFQEADITGITMPITKHNYLVRDVADLPRVIKEAFHIATTGRPGPVLIDLPSDISDGKTRFRYPEKVSLPGYKPTYNGNFKQIKAMASALRKAEKPVLYVGGGTTISGAEQELLELAEKTQIPVVTTLMGMAAFPSSHRLALGMLGMHGTVAANYAVTECDLLVAIGARFDDRVTGKVETFAPQAKIVQIDIDPAEIGKNVPVDIPIVGDIKKVLTDLLPLVTPGDTGAWLAKTGAWKEKYALSYERNEKYIAPQEVLEILSELTKGEAIICTEVGQHQMWVAQYYQFTKARSFLTSGGLGTMGYGLPAAIGAQIGRPNQLVINVAGDGSLQMNIQELATIAAYRLPVKVILLNNSYLGMVRQWQEHFYAKRYAGTFLENPDFIKLAEAYGIKGFLLNEREKIKDVLAEALAVSGPVLVECRVNPEENVFPMVPPNGAINQMMGVMES